MDIGIVCHPDGCQIVSLTDMHRAPPCEFEQRQEVRNHFGRAIDVVDERLEVGFNSLMYAGLKVGHRQIDRRQVEVEVVQVRFGARRESPHRNGCKLLRVDSEPNIGYLRNNVGIESGQSRDVPGTRLHSVCQYGRNVLEREARQQPGQQPIAFLCKRKLLVEVNGSAARQKMARFELQKSRRNQQELARDLHVQLAHRVDVCDVLSHDVDKA